MNSWTEHYCYNCSHWSWDENIYLDSGKVVYPGHCALYSSLCSTAIFNHEQPPRYLSMEGVYEEATNNQVQEAEEERVS